jgi:hypothetical protein
MHHAEGAEERSGKRMHHAEDVEERGGERMECSALVYFRDSVAEIAEFRAWLRVSSRLKSTKRQFLRR